MKFRQYENKTLGKYEALPSSTLLKGDFWEALYTARHPTNVAKDGFSFTNDNHVHEKLKQWKGALSTYGNKISGGSSAKKGGGKSCGAVKVNFEKMDKHMHEHLQKALKMNIRMIGGGEGCSLCGKRSSYSTVTVARNPKSGGWKGVVTKGGKDLKSPPSLPVHSNPHNKENNKPVVTTHLQEQAIEAIEAIEAVAVAEEMLATELFAKSKKATAIFEFFIFNTIDVIMTHMKQIEMNEQKGGTGMLPNSEIIEAAYEAAYNEADIQSHIQAYNKLCGYFDNTYEVVSIVLPLLTEQIAKQVTGNEKL